MICLSSALGLRIDQRVAIDVTDLVVLGMRNVARRIETRSACGPKKIAKLVSNNMIRFLLDDFCPLSDHCVGINMIFIGETPQIATLKED